MGASAWHYIVAFQPNIQAALDALRQKEFAAWKRAHPRKRYKSIDALLKAVGADGTSSILDVNQISTTPLPSPNTTFRTIISTILKTWHVSWLL